MEEEKTDMTFFNGNQYSDKREKLRTSLAVLAAIVSTFPAHVFNKMRVGIQWANVNLLTKGIPLKEILGKTPEFGLMDLGNKFPQLFTHFLKVSLPAESIPLLFQVISFNCLYNAFHLTGAEIGITTLIGFTAGALGSLVVIPFSRLHHILLMSTDSPPFRELFRKTFSVGQLSKATIMQELPKLYSLAPWFVFRGAIEGATFLPLLFYTLYRYDFPLYNESLKDKFNIRQRDSKYLSRCRYNNSATKGIILNASICSFIFTIYDLFFYHTIAKDVLYKDNKSIVWYKEILRLCIKPAYWRMLALTFCWSFQKYLLTFGITQLAYYYHKGFRGMLSLFGEDYKND